MVLRKERPPSGKGNNSKTMSNEQPVSKRQRIDGQNNGETTPTASRAAAAASDSTEEEEEEAPPDLLVVPAASSLSSSASSLLISSSSLSSQSATPVDSSNDNSLVSLGNDEVDRVPCIQDIPDILRVSNSGSHHRQIQKPSPQQQQQQPEASGSSSSTSSSASSVGPSGSRAAVSPVNSEMTEFQNYLIKQCLCGLSEEALRKPFESHYSFETKRVANLNDWPTNKLIQFLSNLQLLFDVYLKQNSKGNICSRIIDVCDALIHNDHNLIDELIDLVNFNNKYVQFLTGRVLASFLVVAKNDLDDNWLKKLVDNFFSFERLDFVAVRKINFSLEIIKRIVEWRDRDTHPLEDDEIGNEGGQYQPSLENNYFAVHFNNDLEAASGSSSNNSSGTSHNHGSSSSSSRTHSNRNVNTNQTSQRADDHQIASSSSYPLSGLSPPPAPSHSNNQATTCHIITLTDSESFDTTNLKCVTIKILENKWPALVKNMSHLITSQRDNNLPIAENCIITFLELWKNIISVNSNLSIVETMPFYVQLVKFELLLNQNLSNTVYKEMLSLFNESLCYGSTLALQDLLPEETCLLAHQIVRQVKDYRILDTLPRRQPENSSSLIGFKGPSVTYESESLEYVRGQLTNNEESIDMDKTVLQKMVLLVLKSVAVTVKEIRSDSSDSSIDSTDYDAFQDMVLIERSIREVLRRLESFIKNTLEFHPDSHFSKILIHLFDDQDDHLIEAMVCTLDVTAGISFRNNAFPELVTMLNPVLTFLEFLKMISNSTDLLLDLLVSNETCFLLYLLRFLKYIRLNWSRFESSCNEFGIGNGNSETLADAMSVLIRLRLQINRLVSKSLYPYDISPVVRLLESCESLYEGNELS